MFRALVLMSAISFSVYATKRAYFLQDDFIDMINEQATTWRAGVNFDPKTPMENIVKRLGSRGVQVPSRANLHTYKTADVAYDKFNGEIPTHFDAREEWKHCTTIGEIRDQGNCGSCWAFATSSAFADRMCIATDGEFNQLLSAEQLTFCCYSCGFGCHGGYPIMAWNKFKRSGLVTGGNYKNKTDGCQPYKVAPCFDDEDGSNSCADQPIEKRHKCVNCCYGDKEIDYFQDHRYTRDAYYLTYAAIQKDVMTHGPIEASFEVYDDFLSYKSGVYVKSENATYLGGHAVKLVGWGNENNTLFWLLANSWNKNWGDNGMFKIRRGTNECGIDNSTTGGVPIFN